MCLFLCRDLLLPLLPTCSYLLHLVFVDYRVHGCDVSSNGAGIGQTSNRSTIQPPNWHNETMTYLLWACGNSAGAGSLLQRNIGHHNLWSEEQRRLQSQNLWTVEQASHRGLHHFRQDDRQRLLWMLLVHRVNIVEQGKQGQAVPRIDDLQWGPLMCRQTFLPLGPLGSQSLGLLPLDSHVDSGHLRCNRTRIGHSLFRSEIQPGDWDNEPVVDILWMKRNRSGTLTLNMLVMVTDSCKQQHQQRDQQHHDPGSLQKLRRGHNQCDQARGYSPNSIDQQTAQPAALGSA